MSDRLTVQINPDCDCDRLRSEVAELQAQVDALTSELSRVQDYPPPENFAELDTASMLPPEITTPEISHINSTVADDSMLPITLPHDRILRPTFNGRNDRGDVHLDRLGSAWRLWGGTPLPTQSGDDQTYIDDVLLSACGEELMSVFFSQCWAQLPVLHEVTFRHNHFEPVSQGLEDPLSKFFVYMVCAISAHVRPITRQGRTVTHQQCFWKAVQYLPALQKTADLEYLQGLLLLCMYGRSEPQCVDMWHTTGLALRVALGLNLHHQENDTNEDLLQSELCKRLFWSAYVMDRSISMAVGRPLGIQDADITVSLPMQLTDEELFAQVDILATRPARTNDMSTFIHVVKLRRLNARIYKSFHTVGQNQVPDDIRDALRQQYGEEANQWLSTAPCYLIAPSMLQTTEWFQIAYHYAILSINRPSHAIPMPTLPALRLCADSAISLISCYGSLFAKNKVNYSFIALNSIFMAAITLLYTLRASSVVRDELTRPVTEININSCLSLVRGISNGRDIGDRCSRIVDRLGKSITAMYDRADTSDKQVDREFMVWFGLKSHCHLEYHGNANITGGEDPLSASQQASYSDAQFSASGMQSIESAWADLFSPDLMIDESINLDFLPLGFA